VHESSLVKGGKENNAEKHSEKFAMIGLMSLPNLNLTAGKRKWVLGKPLVSNLCKYFLIQPKINGVLSW
jgi:hypothetical protein